MCRVQADPNANRHDVPPERIPCRNPWYHVWYAGEETCASQCNKPEPLTRVQV